LHFRAEDPRRYKRAGPKKTRAIERKHEMDLEGTSGRISTEEEAQPKWTLGFQKIYIGFYTLTRKVKGYIVFGEKYLTGRGTVSDPIKYIYIYRN